MAYGDAGKIEGKTIPKEKPLQEFIHDQWNLP